MTGRTIRLFVVSPFSRWRCAPLVFGLAAIVLLTGCVPVSQQLGDCRLCNVVARCRPDWSEAGIDDAREAAFWASQHEKAGAERSVDLYFLAVKLAYRDGAFISQGGSPGQTGGVYHESVAGLIRTAQQFCRYDPLQGIRVYEDGRPRTVPISYHGFEWRPSDFNRLVVADRFVRTELKEQYYCDGVGVPLIVVREKEARFLANRSHFAATANLKRSQQDACDCEAAWTLELANPLTVDCTDFSGRPVRVAGDLSAATRYVIGREKPTYLRDFLRPGVSTAEPKLMMFEPYQRGKIPVLFIHGLLSEPMTWAELFETIKADRELRDRYQFWAFQYPTGAAFLRSAAILRSELASLMASVDPEATDPALSQMVLIGHSMGGLVAQLQITSSGDQLWRSFANRPLESLRLTPEMYAQFQELFYFEPSPHIRRVVYIGTPHRGSAMANRLIGRMGAALVREPEEQRRQYDAFLAANPGVVDKFATRRIPTSIDMLEPNNPILNAMDHLPTAPCVATHSIIGIGGCSLCREPSDGVVPVSSARMPGVESELYVDEDHEDLHRDPDTIREVLRILRRHLQCVDGDQGVVGE